MQAAINPALQAAMTLDQAAQVGEFRPTTPQGAPTVTAQLMQKAMQPQMPPQMPPQPGVPQMAQQAGLGAQIQGMQQQQAQQAMMQQAMQQRAQQQPAGIAGLNPNVGGFADGGIVGYAAGELTEDSKLKQLLRRLPESSRLSRLLFGEEPQGLEVPAAPQEPPPMQDLPIPEIRIAQPAAAQAGASAGASTGTAAARPSVSPSDALFEKSRQLEQQKVTLPVSPQEAIEQAVAGQAAQDELRGRFGLKPIMEQIGAEQGDVAAMAKRREELLKSREEMINQRMREAQQQLPQQGLIEALLGMRGARFGETVAAGAMRGRAYEAGMQQQIAQLQDLAKDIQGLQLDVQSAAMDKKYALDKMRDAVAMGSFKDAMGWKQAAQDAGNRQKDALIKIDEAQAKEKAAEKRAEIGAAVKPGEIERMMATYQNLLRTNPAEAERYLQTVGILRGAGRRPSPEESRQKLLEMYADNWEKMDILEKNQLKQRGIGTFDQYVTYRDKVAGVSPAASPVGGASSDLLKRADAIVGGR